MSINNTPTPQNIISITYQLLQEVGVPTSIRGQMPVITIQFQNGTEPVRNKVVNFFEMLPYLKMLKVRAVALGKQLSSNPELTFDKKIVINYGDPATGTGIPVQLSLGGDPCAEIPSVVFINHAAPFVIGDILYLDNATSLPVTGFDLVADCNSGIIYGLNSATGEVLAATGATCTVPPPVTTPSNITMQLDGVDFDASFNLSANVNCTTDNIATVNATNLPFVCNFELPNRGFGSFIEDYNLPFTPTFTQVYIMAGLNLAKTKWFCYMTYIAPVGIAVINNFTSKGAFNQTVARVRTGIDNPAFQSIALCSPFTGIGGADSMLAACCTVDAQIDNIPQVCGKPDVLADPSNGMSSSILTINPPYPTYITRTSFYLLGVLVTTVDVLTDINNVPGLAYIDASLGVPAPALYDEIRIDLVNPPPPLGKNVFVINDTGSSLTVETDVNVYTFAAGVNGNIVVMPGGNFTNQSGANRKFTFIQSMPGTLDPDEAPNPDTLANLATHVLNVSVANLNYLRAELP